MISYKTNKSADSLMEAFEKELGGNKENNLKLAIKHLNRSADYFDKNEPIASEIIFRLIQNI